jgi:hypothetical protein
LCCRRRKKNTKNILYVSTSFSLLFYLL